jgi:CRISPR-associated endonuclease/helicase Cas3
VYLKAWANGVRPLLTQRGLPPLPDLDNIPSPAYLRTPADIDKAWRALCVAAGPTGETKAEAAIKWIVILADVFGSVDQQPGERVLDVRARIAEELRAVGSPESMEALDRARKKLASSDVALNDMQRAAAAAEGNLILTASTGGGKTIAALAWASRAPGRRVIFAAHTTDAATVLYKDYGLADDRVKHGRAWLDLRWRPTPEDNDKDTREATEEAHVAMSVFQNGTAPITFCTADQVLGLAAFYRKSIMWLPYVLTSQIVFDEVHSYDRHMRGWHERFLQYFPRIRTAHLSATMAHRAVSRLQELTQATYDPTPYERAPATQMLRYRIVVLPQAPDEMPDRCLWFCNTVARCQTKALEHGALAYHSRFRYGDRKAVRDALITQFRSPTSVRVVATQVAEMSLDVDADVMVTEVAPPAAIIQRMGRLNRHGRGGVRTLFVYQHDTEPLPPGKEEHNGLPYADGSGSRRGRTGRDGWRAQYAEWENWLRALSGRDISQADLEAAFQHYMATQAAEAARATIPKLIETERLSVREDGVTVSVVMASDEVGLREGRLNIQECEFSIILSGTRIQALTSAGRMIERRYIVDDTDGTYDPLIGWTST